MINFRYHVVSLAAVFFALAVGLVVGTAAFNGPATEELDNQVTSLRKQNTALRDQVKQADRELEQEEEFATESLPYLIGDKLANRRVLMVVSSDADKEYLDDLMQAFTLANVKVTGRVTLLKKFVDPASTEELLDLVNSTTPTWVTGLPANSNGVETSTALLAAVLVDRTPKPPTQKLLDDGRTQVLAAYREAGFLITGQDGSGTAEAVVMVTGEPYADKEAGKLNSALTTVVQQLDRVGPLVVAGSGSRGDGNLIAAVRGEGTLSKQVSTVDNVASPQGRATLLLALAEQIDGRAGHYGVGAGTTARIPKAAERPRNGS